MQPAKRSRYPLNFMSTQIHIPGITIDEKPEVIHIHSSELLTTLSSSFLGGGFRRVRHILNAQVDKDYNSESPAADLQAIAACCGVNEPFVGLLTAVPMRKVRTVCSEAQGLRVAVVTTAGVGNATSAGVSRPCDSKPGTINIMVLLDAKLSRAAMLNAIITVTEAKCAVLHAMDIRTPDGLLATGTSTDTVTVAMTGRGPTQAYAGPATVVGWLMAKAVRQAVQESLLAP